MNKTAARKLAKYHKFNRQTLYQMLVEALATRPDDYWGKPNSVNALWDNGAYFNLCRNWLEYKEGENNETYPSEIIVIRVLQCAGEFSKVQLPKKKKRVLPTIQCSEKPTLIPSTKVE